MCVCVWYCGAALRRSTSRGPSFNQSPRRHSVQEARAFLGGAMDLKHGTIIGVTPPLPSPFPLLPLVTPPLPPLPHDRRSSVKAAGRSGALFANALARAAHFALQLHHLEDGLFAAAAQVVEEAVVLLGETVQHAEHVACGRRWRRGGNGTVSCLGLIINAL